MNELSFFDKSQLLALVGVSSDTKKFGNQVFQFLHKHGYEVFPVHPRAKSINGVKCFNCITELPPNIDRAIVITPPAETDGVLKQLAAHGIMEVWVQQLSQSADSKNVSESLGLKTIFNRCVFMFAEPVKGIHAFHRWLWKHFYRKKYAQMCKQAHNHPAS
ncbi:MAG: CoA-binding protein [Bacteroidia bacterium]|nr:MAG: CoA-binding protein [Bacteroidia bacterium]